MYPAEHEETAVVSPSRNRPPYPPPCLELCQIVLIMLVLPPIIAFCIMATKWTMNSATHAIDEFTKPSAFPNQPMSAANYDVRSANNDNKGGEPTFYRTRERPQLAKLTGQTL